MSPSLTKLKIAFILAPSIIIGGFEFLRHDLLLHTLTMEEGNVYIVVLTFLLSLGFANWMFRQIERSNERLAAEQAKRAVYEERERLAQELHDHIAQTLFFLNVQLKKGQLDEARVAVSQMDEHVRQAIFNLRTDPGSGTSWTVRLRVWLQEWSALTGIPVDMRVEVPEQTFDPTEEVKLLAIVREAFTNIRKHSQAEHAELVLVSGADGMGSWCMKIRDDGVGPGELAEATDAIVPSMSATALDQQTHPSSAPMLTDPSGSSSSATPVSVKSNRYGLSLIRKHARELGVTAHLRALEAGGTEWHFCRDQSITS